MGTGRALYNPTGSTDIASAVAVLPDGKLLVAAESVGNIHFLRYNPNGSLDLSFGNGGVVISDLGGDEAPLDIKVLADGKFLVHADIAQEFAVLRYNANGSLDTTFGGGDGIASVDITQGGDPSTGFLVQPDGKIVLTGSGTWGGAEFAVVRYNADGTLDSTFSGDGIVTQEIGKAQSPGNGATMDSAGNIYVVGLAREGVAQNAVANAFAIARFSPNGTYDPTYTAIHQMGTGSDWANDAAVQADGKVVMVGQASDSISSAAQGNFGIIRLNTNGTLDTTFSEDGKLRVDFGGEQGPASEVLILADGRILVGGTFNDDLALTRLLPDGSPDPTFGGGTGRVVISHAGLEHLTDMVLQPDGKIILTGGYRSVSYQAETVRLNADGTLDLTFGGDVKDGLAGNDHLVAGATGNWELNGRAGDDILQGLGGNDVLAGNEGHDTLFGEGGIDALFGGAGNDILGGAAGADWMEGGDGNDALYGGADNDRVDGGAGNDTLDGGAGIDTAIGGLGDDWFVVDNAADGVFENAGEGNDVIFSTVTYAIRANVETLSLQGGAAIDAYGDAAANTLIGNNAANFMTGMGGNDWMEGHGGNDWLTGGDGIDRLDGGDGNDVLIGDGGTDILIGGAGADTFRYNSLADSNTTTGFDYIFGFEHNVDKVVVARQGAADTFSLQQSGADTVLWVDYGGNGSNDLAVVLIGVQNVTTTDIILG